MAIKRIMGTETEYGIIGNPSAVLENYNGNKKNHENKSETNVSAVPGLVDRGHFGGDYAHQQMDFNLANRIGFVPNQRRIFIPSSGIVSVASDFLEREDFEPVGARFSHYFGRDDMLANGARFYIDMGHPEYSTPETSNPLALVIADKAGERILQAASGNGTIARIFKNNTDGNNSYGSHENYLVDRTKVQNFQELADFMTSFLVSRIIFTGSGKIGFAEGEKSREMQRVLGDIVEKYASLGKGFETRRPLNELYQRVKEGLEYFLSSVKDNELVYQLSQRADFFEQLIGLQTTYNRPIVNTRDEQLSDGKKYLRFHVICGDANLSEISNYLKFGTMGLVLDLFEDKLEEKLELEEPVQAFHAISRDSSLAQKVKVKGLGEATAIEIQRYFQSAAEKVYRGRDAMTDDILDRWELVLNGLEEDPRSLGRQLDWVIKKNLIDAYMAKTGKSLNDPSVRNIDLQYHELGEKGLFNMLQSRGLVDRIVSDEQIEYAVTNAPSDTRAWIRAELIKRNSIQSVDWDKITLQGQAREIILKEPFKGTKKELAYLFETPRTSEQTMQELERLGFVQERTYKSLKGTKKSRKKKSFSIKFTGGKNARTSIQTYPRATEIPTNED